VPVVTIPQPGPRYRLPYVTMADEAGTEEATRYLIGRGHSRIGVVAGSLTSIFSINRLAGYRGALKDAGMPFVPSLVRNGDFTQDDGYESAAALLAQPSPPTALIALSDFLAMGALRAIRDRGLRMPGDVALVSFGDSPICSLVTPSLTAVNQQMIELGTQAATLLIQLVQGEEVPTTQIVVPTKLVLRESA
jgi:LacI family transcriptional regulator